MGKTCHLPPQFLDEENSDDNDDDELALVPFSPRHTQITLVYLTSEYTSRMN